MRINAVQARKLGLSEPRKRQKAPPPDYSLFDAACEAWGLPVPLHEYPFAPPRKWRFDHLWTLLHAGDGGVVLEVQGAIFSGGRHVRGPALLAEYEKINEAVCRGFRVLFCTPQQINDGSIFPIIKRALEALR